MGFLIREGARLVVRLPQEVDHHKTESIRIQVDQMIRKEPVTEVEFDFSRTMFMDSAGIGLLIGRSQQCSTTETKHNTTNNYGYSHRHIVSDNLRWCSDIPSVILL